MLFSVIRRLKAHGMATLFITHFLGQVFEISDRITVLRNGIRVGEYSVTELSRMELVTHMVGRAVAEGGPSRAKSGKQRPVARAPSEREPVGSARCQAPVFLRATGLGRRGSVRGVDLEIRQGEALGIE